MRKDPIGAHFDWIAKHAGDNVTLVILILAFDIAILTTLLLAIKDVL